MLYQLLPSLICFQDALALAVVTSTFVAEIISTLAFHVVASYFSFDPEFALDALLELLSLRHLLEVFIDFILLRVHLILLARHFFVE